MERERERERERVAQKEQYIRLLYNIIVHDMGETFFGCAKRVEKVFLLIAFFAKAGRPKTARIPRARRQTEERKATKIIPLFRFARMLFVSLLLKSKRFARALRTMIKKLSLISIRIRSLLV